MISFDAWIFRKRRGFRWLHGLSKTNLVKPLYYRCVHPLLDLIRETAVSAADRDRRQENSERIFSEQMFSALICFLPWSILNLKEKSEGNFGRTQFLSKSCCEKITHTNSNIRSCLKGSHATIISRPFPHLLYSLIIHALMTQSDCFNSVRCMDLDTQWTYRSRHIRC